MTLFKWMMPIILIAWCWAGAVSPALSDDIARYQISTNKNFAGLDIVVVDCGPLYLDPKQFVELGEGIKSDYILAMYYDVSNKYLIVNLNGKYFHHCNIGPLFLEALLTPDFEYLYKQLVRDFEFYKCETLDSPLKWCTPSKENK